jgi:hypothetical protein
MGYAAGFLSLTQTATDVREAASFKHSLYVAGRALEQRGGLFYGVIDLAVGRTARRDKLAFALAGLLLTTVACSLFAHL